MCPYSVFLENTKIKRKQDKKFDLQQGFEPEFLNKIPPLGFEF